MQRCTEKNAERRNLRILPWTRAQRDSDAAKMRQDRERHGSTRLRPPARRRSVRAQRRHPAAEAEGRLALSRRPAVPGMPGPYPGRVIAVTSERCVDTETSAADDEVVREMMARGHVRAHRHEDRRSRPGGASSSPPTWSASRSTAAAIPWCVSAYEIVAEVVRQLDGGRRAADADLRLRAVPEPARRRQLRARTCPRACSIVAAETRQPARRTTAATTPTTYVEADLFGEEDTRSNMMRLVSEKLTKIINIPNMKDHGATGATGCLKNIAYGSFSNVARTHYNGKSHTYSFVGTLASVEPLRSRTVLQIMDGLRGVWHGGPFARTRQLRLLPEADPVRHRSGGHRPPAARHHRRQAQGRGRDLDLRPLARPRSRWTTAARATPIPTSTSSSASPATWSTRRRSASAWPTTRRSRSQDIEV